MPGLMYHVMYQPLGKELVYKHVTTFKMYKMVDFNCYSV